jgi:hypothetical protein
LAQVFICTSYTDVQCRPHVRASPYSGRHRKDVKWSPTSRLKKIKRRCSDLVTYSFLCGAPILHPHSPPLKSSTKVSGKSVPSRGGDLQERVPDAGVVGAGDDSEAAFACLALPVPAFNACLFTSICACNTAVHGKRGRVARGGAERVCGIG